MSQTAASRTTIRRVPWILIPGLFVVIAWTAANLGHQSLAHLSSSSAPMSSSMAASPIQVPRIERAGALGEDDGAIPAGTTVFDDDIPGIANLDPALLGALRRATTDAADHGFDIFVNSGWRSPAYQEQLLREAVSKYGSENKAARWVGTPTTSAHVSGDAVDIGPFDAAAWLSKHGAKYRLCQIYRNEPWHFEVRPDASRSWVSSHVRRPDARSEDAAVTIGADLRFSLVASLITMTRYLVLLRGINVGGRNKVPMAALRELLESHGHTKVSTYIASGNVILSSDQSAATIKRELEEALPKVFKLDSELIAVLVLTRAQLRAVVRKRPKGFGDHPETYHSDAVFLMGIDAPTAMKVFDPRPGVDEVWPGTGVIYSQRLSAQRTKSRLGKIVGTPAYKSMTIRSWQTTIALLERMEAEA